MKIIQDEFTSRTDLSRQQIYQLRHERDHLCRLCSEPVAAEPEGCKLCPAHLTKQRRWCNPVKKKARAHPPENYNPADLI